MVFLVKDTFPKWMLYLGTSATLLAMVTAGSRAVIAECLQVVACIGFLGYFRPNEFGKIAGSVLGFSIVGLIIYSQVDLFKEGLDFLSLRFEEAANVEGTPIEAYFKLFSDNLLCTHITTICLQMVWKWIRNCNQCRCFSRRRLWRCRKSLGQDLYLKMVLLLDIISSVEIMGNQRPAYCLH